MIYRGTSQPHDGEDDIQSSIYREYKDENIFNDSNTPMDEEKKIVDRARHLFKPDTTNIEILTELRHYGGDTALIDFSRDLMAALFFACNSDMENEGLITCCLEADLEKLSEIDYDDRPTDSHIIEPVRTPNSQARTLAQSSVFIYAPEGYLDTELCTFFYISPESKIQVLEQLRNIHNISARTIYNDLPGFLENEKKFRESTINLSRGMTKLINREHGEAIQYFNKAIKFRHDNEDALFLRGFSRCEIGELKDSIEDFSKVIRLNPDDSSAYNLRGFVYNNTEEYDKAIPDLDEAIRLNPYDVDAHIHRADAKDAIGDADGAMEDREIANILSIDLAQKAHGLGKEKAIAGEHEEAIKEYGKAIDYKPDFIDPYYDRGLAKLELRQYKEAIEDFDEYIRLKPNDPGEAHYHRGVAKLEMRDNKGALVDLDEAISIEPDNTAYYTARAKLKHEMGDYAEAIIDYNEVIKRNPDDVDALKGRGKAHEAHGDIDAAEADLSLAKNAQKKLSKQVGGLRRIRSLRSIGKNQTPDDLL